MFLDQYKTQKMCDKAVDDCIAALKIVSYWFVTSKMIKILFYCSVPRRKYTLR